jgi:hypothetical protein
VTKADNVTKTIELRKPKSIHIEFTDADDDILHIDYELQEVTPKHVAVAILNLAQEFSVQELRAIIDILENLHGQKTLENRSMAIENREIIN